MKALAFMNGIPTALLERFTPGSEHWQTIENMRREHHKNFPASVAAHMATQSSPPSGTQASVPHAIPMPSVGPDYSVQPPKSTQEMFDLETIPLMTLKALMDEGKLWLCFCFVFCLHSVA